MSRIIVQRPQAGDGAPPETSPLLQACRRAGLHLTRRRRLLVLLLEEAGEPICIETYHDRLNAKGVNVARSTLYRLVADLMKAGLLTETIGRDRRRYAPAI